MELATHAVNNKPRDAYYWRLFATAASFFLFGLGGLCLRLLVFPLLSCLPGSANTHQRRARHTISKLFWFFIRLMQRLGILTFSVDGADKLGRPGQMIVANHPSLIDVVFLIGLMRQTNCVVKQSLWQNPFTRGPVRDAGYISNDGSADMLDAAAIALRGATIITPVVIKVSPTTLTKAEPWYRIPKCRFHFSLRVGADIEPQAFATLGPAPQASRKLNDYLHHYFIKELAEDERQTPP